MKVNGEGDLGGEETRSNGLGNHDQIQVILYQNYQITMINGLYPSQLGAAEQMRTSHYRNLSRIVNKNKMNVSWMPSDFMAITRRKKQNHENWKNFTRRKIQEEKFKQNAHIYNRLRNISDSRSRYALKTEPSFPKDPLLHHNYLYECQRRYTNIEKNNSMIASKILNAKGTLSCKKDKQAFESNKLKVSRLQKFGQQQRMNRLVCQSLHQRFLHTSDRFNSRIKSLNPESP